MKVEIRLKKEKKKFYLSKTDPIAENFRVIEIKNEENLGIEGDKHEKNIQKLVIFNLKGVGFTWREAL